MVYKHIFYAIIGMMWAVGAHCSVNGGKLTYQEFPKTENDLSFVEMMKLKAESYKPFFDKQVYYPIRLELGDAAKTGAGGTIVGGDKKDNAVDWCPDKLSTKGAMLASDGASGDLASADIEILKNFNRSVVVGGMLCDYGVSEEINELSYLCLIKCRLTEDQIKHSGKVCFYSNYSGMGKRYVHDPAGMKQADGDYVVLFSQGILDGEFHKNDRLGEIQDKEKFFYCIAEAD